jgi:hypothetical protein
MERLVRKLWCPWCGKRHADEGEFATREHHTHLCVEDVHGAGCGMRWRLEAYVFGSPSDAPPGVELDRQAEDETSANWRYAGVLVDVYNEQVFGKELVGGWDSVAISAAFTAGVRALKRDHKLVEANKELEHYRERLAQQSKSSEEYHVLVGKLETLQSEIRSVLSKIAIQSVPPEPRA